MTIAKNTNKAKQIISEAQNIRCYSSSNNFSGAPLSDNPVVWGGEVKAGVYQSLVEISQAEFLARELNSRHAKLTVSDHGRFTLHIHSNLWYEWGA